MYQSTLKLCSELKSCISEAKPSFFPLFCSEELTGMWATHSAVVQNCLLSYNLWYELICREAPCFTGFVQMSYKADLWGLEKKVSQTRRENSNVSQTQCDPSEFKQQFTDKAASGHLPAKLRPLADGKVWFFHHDAYLIMMMQNFCK